MFKASRRSRSPSGREGGQMPMERSQTPESDKEVELIQEKKKRPGICLDHIRRRCKTLQDGDECLYLHLDDKEYESENEKDQDVASTSKEDKRISGNKEKEYDYSDIRYMNKPFGVGIKCKKHGAYICKKGCQSEDHSSTKDEVCVYFIRKLCKRGDRCKYKHPAPDLRVVMKRLIWLKPCKLYATDSCKDLENCSYLHVSEADQNQYTLSGLISEHILGQAIRKVLQLDIPLENDIQVCKENLNNDCTIMNCPFKHCTRETFIKKVIATVRIEFEKMYGMSKTLFPSVTAQEAIVKRLLEPSNSACSSAYPMMPFGQIPPRPFMPYMPMAPVPPMMNMPPPPIMRLPPPMVPQMSMRPGMMNPVPFTGVPFINPNFTQQHAEEAQAKKLIQSTKEIIEENEKYKEYNSLLEMQNADIWSALDPNQPATHLEDIRDLIVKLFEEINWKSKVQEIGRTLNHGPRHESQDHIIDYGRSNERQVSSEKIIDYSSYKTQASTGKALGRPIDTEELYGFQKPTDEQLYDRPIDNERNSQRELDPRRYDEKLGDERYRHRGAALDGNEERKRYSDRGTEVERYEERRSNRGRDHEVYEERKRYSERGVEYDRYGERNRYSDRDKDYERYEESKRYSYRTAEYGRNEERNYPDNGINYDERYEERNRYSDRGADYGRYEERKRYSDRIDPERYEKRRRLLENEDEPPRRRESFSRSRESSSGPQREVRYPRSPSPSHSIRSSIDEDKGCIELQDKERTSKSKSPDKEDEVNTTELQEEGNEKRTSRSKSPSISNSPELQEDTSQNKLHTIGDNAQELREENSNRNKSPSISCIDDEVKDEIDDVKLQKEENTCLDRSPCLSVHNEDMDEFDIEMQKEEDTCRSKSPSILSISDDENDVITALEIEGEEESSLPRSKSPSIRSISDEENDELNAPELEVEQETFPIKSPSVSSISDEENEEMYFMESDGEKATSQRKSPSIRSISDDENDELNALEVQEEDATSRSKSPSIKNISDDENDELYSLEVQGEDGAFQSKSPNFQNISDDENEELNALEVLGDDFFLESKSPSMKSISEEENNELSSIETKKEEASPRKLPTIKSISDEGNEELNFTEIQRDDASSGSLSPSNKSVSNEKNDVNDDSSQIQTKDTCAPTKFSTDDDLTEIQTEVLTDPSKSPVICDENEGEDDLTEFKRKDLTSPRKSLRNKKIHDKGEDVITENQTKDLMYPNKSEDNDKLNSTEPQREEISSRNESPNSTPNSKEIQKEIESPRRRSGRKQKDKVDSEEIQKQQTTTNPRKYNLRVSRKANDN